LKIFSKPWPGVAKRITPNQGPAHRFGKGGKKTEDLGVGRTDHREREKISGRRRCLVA